MKRFFLIITLLSVLMPLMMIQSSASVTVREGDEVILSREFRLQKLSVFEIVRGVNYGSKLKSLLDEGYGLEDALNLVAPDLGNVISGIIAGRRQEPDNARAIFDPDGTEMFKFVPEIAGRKVDEDALIAAAISGLKSGKVDIKLCYTDIEPSIKADDLREATALRGTFTTTYSSSSAARKSNIALAAKLINGAVIEDGGQFSFNKTVGQRSSARGFMEAKIIVDGKFTSGVGGGVCQASTTLYNCALLSDLKIVEARRHSLEVGYVEPSFDAMVSSQSDLKFLNDTGGSIYIRAVADGKKITFEIYGKPLCGVEVKRVSESRRSVNFKVIYVADESVAEGERKLITAGQKGLESRGYLCYYQEGALKSKVEIRHDFYLPKDAVVAVNPAEFERQISG